MKLLPLPEEPLAATGPAKLIESISPHFPSPRAILALEIDRSQTISRLWQLGHQTLPADSTLVFEDLRRSEQARIVLILTFNERLPEAGIRSLAEQWLTTFATEMPSVLDVLLVGPTHWWSALCHDSDCCPVLGRPRIGIGERPLTTWQRRELWGQWQQLAGISRQRAEFSEADLAMLVCGLADLRLRDLILAHAGQNAEHRDAWLTATRALTAMPEFKDNIALGTIVCALIYLQGNLKEARDLAEQLLDRDGSYSLALLLHRGLVIKAPPQTLEAAFCNASISQLLSDSGTGGQAA